MTWLRKNLPLPSSAKHSLRYDEMTGKIFLQINQLGPGDEGDYVCVCRNQFGEAICTVTIQPEMLAGKAGAPMSPVYDTTPSQPQQILYPNSMFKVDTFEYRLMREIEYRQNLTRKYQDDPDVYVISPPNTAPGPPRVIQKPKNSKVTEGGAAQFFVKVEGVNTKVVWFRDGQRLRADHRLHVTTPDVNTVAITIDDVKMEEAGYYTMFCENPWGCVAASAQLVVEKGKVTTVQQQTRQQQQQQQQQQTYLLHQSTSVYKSEETTTTEKALAPTFTRLPIHTQNQTIDVEEGKLLRLDCRVNGRPAPEVTWYLNNQQLKDDATHKVLVNEQGSHSLMITSVSRMDQGSIVCVAKNKSGETRFSLNLRVIEKEQIVAPKFVERFSTVSVKEGETVVLSARAVGNPVPTISWQKDGVPLLPNANVTISSRDGASTLEIRSASQTDAGWLQCTAQNSAGSTATRARLFVEKAKEEVKEAPWRLNLPKPMKVIEPEKPPSPEVIYLRHVELQKQQRTQQMEVERTYDPPVFLIPLRDQISQYEGGRAHFEAKIHPVGDPTIQIQWFKDGVPMQMSSRANTTYRFGFIALDLLGLMESDAGLYTCVVSSATGSAESNATLTVLARETVTQISDSTYQQIQQLESHRQYQRTESQMEPTFPAPKFGRVLKQTISEKEGKSVHLEAQLHEPISDPSLRVEWFKNGQPLTASSRITTITNFGYMSLNIMHLRMDDAGVYTVRAVNRAGEAVSQTNLVVEAVQQKVEGFSNYQAIEELEAYKNITNFTSEIMDTYSAPQFKSVLKDQLSIKEGTFAHFEARVEPIGDDSMKVAWYKDGKPIEASSRITTFFNFGYVALTIKQVTARDAGEYTCVVTNNKGQAQSSSKLTVQSRQESIVTDSSHVESLAKIQHLETRGTSISQAMAEHERVMPAPRFLGPLKCTAKIKEGQRAHFETRLEPQSDSTMSITWLLNGQPIQPANRISAHEDFGYVALDINKVRLEDTGIYTCIARNSSGEATISAQMEVLEVIQEYTEKEQRVISKAAYDAETIYQDQYYKSKPVFLHGLSPEVTVMEGKNLHLEARLEHGCQDVQWYFNQKPISVGSRFRTYNDFGYVALDISQVTTQDTGVYTVVARNTLGQAESSSRVRVDVTRQESYEMSQEIEMLEARGKYQRQEEMEDTQPKTKPIFMKPLKNHQTIELSNVHFETRLQPVGDPTMKVEWFCNGKPIPVGAKFRPAYEFDYVALDVLCVYTRDSGVYTVTATNALGSESCSCTLKVISRGEAELGGYSATGLEHLQYLEDSTMRHQKRSELVVEEVIKPRFLTKPKDLNLKESQRAHFECKLEPINDPNLTVQWFKDGRPLQAASRMRNVFDFGYVALDILQLIAEDSGIYTCVATNAKGSDEVTVRLNVSSSKSIIQASQVNVEKLQYIEDKSSKKFKYDEEIITQAPVFTTSMKNIEIKEGQRAHFESRIIPVSDENLVVEWFKDGQPVLVGSRINEICSFGYVALDVLQATPADSGTYSIRARNALGEAVTSATLSVQPRRAIISDSICQSSLQNLQYLESRHQQKAEYVDEMVQCAPMFTVPVRDARTVETRNVHFEARLIPVGDPNLTTKWYKNDVELEASNRISTIHDFGFVSLDIKYVNLQDEGTYTCRAVNHLGQAVTSAKLIIGKEQIQQLSNSEQLEKLRYLEDAARYDRSKRVEEFRVEAPPRFVTELTGRKDHVELTSCHMEARIEPYPDDTMKVTWEKDGLPLPTGSRFKPLHNFGFAALDVLQLVKEDSGKYTCRAKNNWGEATSTIEIAVHPQGTQVITDSQHVEALEKIHNLEARKAPRREEVQPAISEKPNFVRPLRNAHVGESQPVHLEATLTPANDPSMKVEWFRQDGKPIPQGHRFKTTYDFGYVALDILYAYPEDSGNYICKAKNNVGEAVTTCSVNVESQKGLLLDTLDEQRLQKIKALESYEQPKHVEAEMAPEKPVFITPLNNLENLKEGDHAHLECRLTPVNDPNLKVNWFVNGVKLKTGHRFKTTHDFGYVALDILYTYPEDSGNYVCQAENLAGSAVNTCNITCQENKQIYYDSHHPEGWAKIRALESIDRQPRPEVVELPTQPPMFMTPLVGKTEIPETSRAHFECRVEPARDPKMTVQWFKDGKELPVGNRFRTTFDFGYIALDIGQASIDDSGKYKVVAKNDYGQAESEIDLKVLGPGSAVITDSSKPLEKFQALENKAQEAKMEVAPTFQRPVFTVPLNNIDNVQESQHAHFEARLIPVGDPNLKVEWFRNEMPVEDSSRIKTTHDFGYVALDIQAVRDSDQGVYQAKAVNLLGEAVTTAKLQIVSSGVIDTQSQHPEGYKKIQQLEDKPTAAAQLPDKVYEKPVFVSTLTGPAELYEGQNAHLECRVIPVGDPTLTYEWYLNGVELKMGSRYTSRADFGLVTLDIKSVIPEDSGLYSIKVRNKAGEAINTHTMKVHARSNIQGDSVQPSSWGRIQELESRPVEPPKFLDTSPKQPPVWTRNIESKELLENQRLYLEGFVEPRGDPTLGVQWFKNGVAISMGTRATSTFDFGLATLEITGIRESDVGLYTCVAKNAYGEAVTTCSVKVESKHWLQSDSFRPDAIPRIQELEAPAAPPAVAPDAEFGAPVFITHLNNIEVDEGEASLFECQVEPWKDTKLEIEWFQNNKKFKHSTRSRPKNEFGKIELAFDSTFLCDEGVYIVKATNAKGSAQTTGTLKVRTKKSIYTDTQHPKGQEGLDKVAIVEGELEAKSRKGPIEDVVRPPVKPWFDPPLKPEFHFNAGEPINLDCRVEPKEDPDLQIEWLHNGKPLDTGARFKSTLDFGFVNLCMDKAQAERDEGVYTCHAWNKHGECFTSCTVTVEDKSKIINTDTQHPKGSEGLGKIAQLEAARAEANKRGEKKEPAGIPPKFTTPLENLRNLVEGDLAHFEANLIPLGDETMTVEWFCDGQPLEASHRFRTVYAFGLVVLEILDVKLSDSKKYKCVARNAWGMDEVECDLECVLAKDRVVKPKFTRHLKDVQVPEGTSAHLEATLIPVGDPDMEVVWYRNGEPLEPSSRIKTVYDFGFCVLDINGVTDIDEGEYECRARNKHGSDKTKAILKLILGRRGVQGEPIDPDAYAKILELEAFGKEKPEVSKIIKLQPPKFTIPFQDVTLKEGQSAHFEARFIPIDDPDLKVTWWKDGVQLRDGHKFRIFSEFGIAILDVLWCYEEDSGVYECRIENKLGSDVTKAVLKCTPKPSIIYDPQIPKSMMSALDKIPVLEDKSKPVRPEQARKGQAPVFTVPLENVQLREGENAHFETKLFPVDDPKLKVEWLKDGIPLRAGSRFKTFHDFSFVILEIASVYESDSGVYTCRAWNDYGEAVISCTLGCAGKRNLIMDSQLGRLGLDYDKIAKLEGLGSVDTTAHEEEDTGRPPELTPLSDIEVVEGGLAHFECRMTPTNDPKARVEWFHNGKSINLGSRMKQINEFGFAILEIGQVLSRDSGIYVCKVTNAHGTATSEAKLTVKGARPHIITEPQLPSQFRNGTESLQKLEEALWQKKPDEIPEEQLNQPPVFTKELDDIEIIEGQPAHFDCRVEPANDSSMRIEWYFNGKPMTFGSRTHTSDEFGFISLDFDWTFARDSGEYICRAVNAWGFATTRAKMICKGRQGIIRESQLPSGSILDAEKLHALERGPIKEDRSVPEPPSGPPVFIEKLISVGVSEGEAIHLEARVEPKTDSNMQIIWLHNGKELKSGSRFKQTLDFGYVALDILYSYEEDSGEYCCIARNKLGEDKTVATVQCKSQPSIILQNQMPRGMKKSETLVQMEAAIKKYTSEVFLTEEDIYDADKKQPPRFVTQIQSQTELTEMQSTKFECQLAPVGDPNMKVEWFFNGKPLSHKNRLQPIYDFGYVAMNFQWVYPEDSGEYVCVATNLYGRDETRAVIKTTGKPSIVYDSQLPKGMQSIDKIRQMESSWMRGKQTEEVLERKREPPVFVTKPNPVEVWEGEWSKFCCRVTGYPRPRVLWIVNGKTVMNGSRYKLTYDGMWHLDIPKTRLYDHGKVEVIAKNSAGEAYAVTELIVKNRHDDYRALLKNSPRPWYDQDLKTYQEDRYEELERVFQEKLGNNRSQLHINEQGEYKTKEEEETEWQARSKQLDYSKLRDLEEGQITKEQRLRDSGKQQPAPPTLTRAAAQVYEEQIDKGKQAILEHAQKVTRKDISQVFNTARSAEEEEETNVAKDVKLKSWKKDEQAAGPTLLPSESETREKQVSTHVSKQTQKGREGDTEITRHITETETEEKEHGEKTVERVVEAGGKPKFKKAPIFTKKIQPCRAYEKEQARFDVEFDGDPKPKIKWFREDFEIVNSQDFQIHTYGFKSTLVIREVFAEDSGVFSVIIENPGGQAKCSANLIVEEKSQRVSKSFNPPSFTKTIDDKKVKVGSTLKLECVISATKPIDVYWIKNGTKIAPSGRIKPQEYADMRYALTITNVNPEDQGTYEVVGINAAGEARCEAQVTIQESAVAPKAAPSPEIKFVKPLVKESKAVEGQPSTIQVQVQTAVQPSNVVWTKNGVELQPTNLVKPTSKLVGSVRIYGLEFNQVSPEDGGEYAVTIFSQDGKTISSQTQFIVSPPQKEAGNPPKLMKMDDVECLEGEPAQFRVEISQGTAPFNVQWFREDALIPPNEDFAMLLEGRYAVLIIKSTYEEDSGTFTVRVTNAHGQAETSAKLTVTRREKLQRDTAKLRQIEQKEKDSYRRFFGRRLTDQNLLRLEKRIQEEIGRMKETSTETTETRDSTLMWRRRHETREERKAFETKEAQQIAETQRYKRRRSRRKRSSLSGLEGKKRPRTFQ